MFWSFSSHDYLHPNRFLRRSNTGHFNNCRREIPALVFFLRKKTGKNDHKPTVIFEHKPFTYMRVLMPHNCLNICNPWHFDKRFIATLRTL
jgi:hypothetical protein